jgi:aryl-phospho-beta-D-glucosidase BglC (GH1 family)
MKSPLKPIVLFVNLFLCAWGFAQTPVAINGQLKVTGTKLTNKNGYAVQLRGMSSHGIQWYSQCLTDASLDAVANDWGADVFRISMYIQEGGYESNPTYYTNLVKTLVNKVTARGMYALIDFHMLTPGDPNANTSRAITFFTEIANTFKNNNNILYEICNEPNGNVSWATIKNYANQVIPVIRAIDNDAPIIVGTRAWSSLGLSEGGSAQEIVNSPLNFANILYTFHFYAKDHRDSYLSHLDWASDRLPIFVTEFGTQEASGDGPNDMAMSQRYIDLMRTKKISWANWNYSDDFRSGAVWTTGTCGGTNWTTSRLKEAGLFIRNNMLSPADDFGGPTNPNPKNIALNKSVTVSSIEDGTLGGSYAVDGNGSTRWASAEGVDPQWITVDLGASYNISRIKFVWEAAYAKNFLVQVSADNSNWTTVRNIQGNTSLTNDYTGLTATGRYVRMYGTARGSAYGYSIYELEVYGTAATTRTSTTNTITTINNLEQRIQVYPVPSKDEVTITLPESTQRTQVVVTDLNGKTYYTGIASGNVHKLHINKYPAGIYVVQLINGDKKIIKRIVKK